jgi:hypothetical protein
MTIEMLSPQELFKDPEMADIATGKSVGQARKNLHDKTKAGDPISVAEIAEVNTFSRLECMQEKTRELTGFLTGHTSTEEIQKMMDTYDLLAMDWVYSDELKWDGSMADVQMKKIISLNRRAS